MVLWIFPYIQYWIKEIIAVHSYKATRVVDHREQGIRQRKCAKFFRAVQNYIETSNKLNLSSLPAENNSFNWSSMLVLKAQKPLEAFIMTKITHFYKKKQVYLVTQGPINFLPSTVRLHSDYFILSSSVSSSIAHNPPAVS